MSTLRDAAAEYLEMRRKLGYKLSHAGYLWNFVSFMEERNASVITCELAVQWAQQPASIKPVTWSNRLTVVRTFAKFRLAFDLGTEVPGSNLLPHPPKRATPHLFTESEIERLLQAALDLPNATWLKRRTYHCLLGLLFVSGMRISEALGLKVADVDLRNCVFHVNGAKTGNLRMVPFHQSTREVLLNYKRCRNRTLKEKRSEYFLVSDAGEKLNVVTVRNTFYSILRQIGLPQRVNRNGPRLHDARHQFAINTILRSYRNQENVELVLPMLAKILGHTNVNDTYWYLSACPELMGVAVRLLENHWEGTTL